MPDSSSVCGASSDEEIVFRKRTIPKFVDSDEENVQRISSPKPTKHVPNFDDSDEEIIQRHNTPTPKSPGSDKENDSKSSSVKPKRRIVRRRNVPSESDDELQAVGEEDSVFERLKTKRKQKQNRTGEVKNSLLSVENIPSEAEHQTQPTPVFADKDLYDAECSEDEDDDRDRKKSNGVDQERNEELKALFDDKELYDNEGSEEESQRPGKTAKPRKEKKASKKGSLSEKDSIHSETQRMVRQSRVSLPYHRPRQRTLEEFLQRRTSTSVPVKSVRMSVKQLAVMEKRLKERAKLTEEFYKSSSDEEEVTEKPAETISPEQPTPEIEATRKPAEMASPKQPVPENTQGSVVGGMMMEATEELAETDSPEKPAPGNTQGPVVEATEKTVFPKQFVPESTQGPVAESTMVEATNKLVGRPKESMDEADKTVCEGLFSKLLLATKPESETGVTLAMAGLNMETCVPPDEKSMSVFKDAQNSGNSFKLPEEPVERNFKCIAEVDEGKSKADCTLTSVRDSSLVRIGNSKVKDVPSFKRNLSKLLDKEGVNASYQTKLLLEGDDAMSLDVDMAGRNLNTARNETYKKNLSKLLDKESGNASQQTKLLLEGDDAMSLDVDMAAGILNTARNEAELPSMILEGDDATLRLMLTDNTQSGCDNSKFLDTQKSFVGIDSFKTPEVRQKLQRIGSKDETSSSSLFGKMFCDESASESLVSHKAFVGVDSFKTPEVKRKRQSSGLKDESSSSSLFGKLFCGETMSESSTPRLDGSPSKVIDLDSTPEPCGVLVLMNRFLKHSTLKKPQAEAKVNIGIVTAEGGENGVPEVKKESVSVLLSGDESTSTTLPGAKLKLLKQQLAQQMAQQREQEWLRRQQESQDIEEKALDERSDCGAEDDEEELFGEDNISSESEEEEEEEEEGRVRTKETRIKSAFVDDEAEVSDDGEESDDEDEEEDLPEEGTTSPVWADKQASSGLQRTRTFDPFSSQEDCMEDDQSVVEDADIPPYQVGGALTPTIEEPSVPPINKAKPAPSLGVADVPSPSHQLLQLCAGSDKAAPENATDKEIEAELLGLCSGKFLTQSVEPSQDGEGSEDFQLPETQPVMQSQDAELADTQPVPEVNLDMRKSLRLLLSSDEEDTQPGELLDKKMKKRFHKKLYFSDDENEGDEKEEEEDSDDEDDVKEAVKEVEYDSEENEITEVPRLAKDFFEEEAELSESEWGSADEDEKDLDTLDWEEGDEEKLDQKQVKEQLGKIHMRRLLDDDQHEVRLLQELYLEDGEFHSEGGGRQRQFRWKNLSLLDDFGDNKNTSDDEAVAYGDDEEDEQEWRRMRFARESFLQEQKEKAQVVETTEVEFAEKLKLRLGRSQAQLQTFSRQTKRGSFLARSEATLARIGQLMRSTSDSGVLAPTNSRNFVFTALSPEKKGQDNPKVTKRKSSAPSLPAIKKPRLSDGLLDRLTF